MGEKSCSSLTLVVPGLPEYVLPKSPTRYCLSKIREGGEAGGKGIPGDVYCAALLARSRVQKQSFQCHSPVPLTRPVSPVFQHSLIWLGGERRASLSRVLHSLGALEKVLTLPLNFRRTSEQRCGRQIARLRDVKERMFGCLRSRLGAAMALVLQRHGLPGNPWRKPPKNVPNLPGKVVQESWALTVCRNNDASVKA